MTEGAGSGPAAARRTSSRPRPRKYSQSSRIRSSERVRPAAISETVAPWHMRLPDGGTVDMTRSADPRKLTFTQTYPGEMRIDKVFTFHPDKYSFEMEVRLHNLADFPLNQNGGLTWYQYVDPSAPTDSYGHDGPVSFYRQEHRPPRGRQTRGRRKSSARCLLGRVREQVFHRHDDPPEPVIDKFPDVQGQQQSHRRGSEGTEERDPPRAVGLFDYSLYLGPKDYSLLKAQNIGWKT